MTIRKSPAAGNTLPSTTVAVVTESVMLEANVVRALLTNCSRRAMVYSSIHAVIVARRSNVVFVLLMYTPTLSGTAVCVVRVS